ncbi:hypothetical protein [Streptomyces sp. TN58]|uniref:hypothetical protein n=1 Tax=Streptomyces sp. TN58 TaxID=234612 RepID=UPI00095089A1|nr:hypothetical protein [Streptomyces sp. TN58]APU38961.1 hypothetical protein BSL84_03435 [Streptomyces sp. TN58]
MEVRREQPGQREQRGRRAPADRRRFLLFAAVPLLAACAGTAYAVWPGPAPSGPRVRVRTDPEPLNARFGPYVGTLVEAHWLGYDIDEPSGGSRTVPGPDSRIRLVGIARLAAGGAAAVTGRAEYAFTSGGAAPSALPAELEPYAPAGAAWQHSPRFDAHANKGQSEGNPSGRYHFDPARDLVRFDLLYLYT